VSIRVSTVVDAPLDEVFAWHTRPGAFARLLPPWQPLRIRREATDLRDGRAVLALPGGLRVVSQHYGYDPPNCFRDELVRPPVRWKHEHRFEAVDPGATRLVDSVDTPVPARLVRPTFAYRYRQLAGDLAAHTASRQLGGRPMTVAVTGSTGLVGTALCAFLATGGHHVVRLVRHSPAGPGERSWDPRQPDAGLLDGVDAVVHLAGASIGGRFTEGHKAAIYGSRIGPTRRLAEVAATATNGPTVFVSASAVGFYGSDRGDELLDESSERGTGFLSDVVAGWEAEAAPAAGAGLRVVHVRTGVVQSPRGGALRLLRPLYTLGLGGPIGDGTAWLSWIGIDDLLDVYLHALVDDRLAGPVNAVAPAPVQAGEYARVLARTLRRPALPRIPSLGVRLLLGSEGAQEVALASQRVRPAALESAGHRFRHPSLAQALAHQFGRSCEPPA